MQLLNYTASRCLATVLRRDAGVRMLYSGVLVDRVPATALPRTLSDAGTMSRDALLKHDAYERSDKLKLRRLDRTFLWSCGLRALQPTREARPASSSGPGKAAAQGPDCRSLPVARALPRRVTLLVSVSVTPCRTSVRRPERCCPPH